MERGTRRFLFLVALALFSSGARAAYWQYKLGGSYKAILENEELREQGLFSTDDIPLTEQRLRLDGTLSKDWFFAELADEGSFVYQKAFATSIPVPDFTPTSFWPATSQIVSNSTTQLTNRVDRAFVQVSAGAVEIKAGKQIIDEGVGHIFNAVSQVARYPFTYVDQEYPKTEDAVAFLWKGSLTLEARYLPHVAGQKEDSFHLRAKGSKNGYDIALTTGRSDDKPYAGLEAAGNLGDSILRGEVVGYEWQSQGAVQALLGWDDVFSPKLSGQFELFYNGFGQASGYVLRPLIHRSAPYRGRYYAGSALTWELSPRWKGVFDAILNLGDPSALLQVFLEFSLQDNLVAVIGRYQGIAGNPQSEFGGKLPIPSGAPAPVLSLGLPDLTYLEFKYYF